MSIQSTGLGDDERLVVSPRRARHMLNCGNTRLYELLAAGELDSFLDGRSRKITVSHLSLRAVGGSVQSGRGKDTEGPRRDCGTNSN
jgi:hypothetical protein